ncbi:MAG: putative sulfate exporter family transporter [Candidatus Lokiarchaeota archaeon]|nr:putative sulfate exporter family transporter [Candidatus Lokiarchaeota archaeon]
MSREEEKLKAKPEKDPAKEMSYIERSLFGVRYSKLHTIIPGLAIVIGLAFFSMWLSDIIGKDLMGFEKSPISAVMICLILGLIINNVFKLPNLLSIGFKFVVKKLLRLGIILLGVRLSIFSVFELGLIGIPIVLICIASALIITTFLNKKLKQPKRLGTLIAVGTSICGVSAIVATSPVIEAKEEETAYAVAVITVFGLIATIGYPFLVYFLFGGDATKAGLWLGTSIHDTSQVTGAALVFADFWNLPIGLDVATVTKLVRNVFMILVIPLMSFLYIKNQVKETKESSETTSSVKSRVNFKKLIPVFVIGFLLVSVFRSIGDVGINTTSLAFGFLVNDSWDGFIKIVKDFATILFVIALGGVGLSTDFSKFKGLGIKPFLVGLFAALTIGIVSFASVSLLGGLIIF